MDNVILLLDINSIYRSTETMRITNVDFSQEISRKPATGVYSVSEVN